MVLIFVMYAISASTFLLAKQLLLYSSPLFLVGIRTLIAGLFFLCAVLLTTKHPLSNIKKFLLPCMSIALYSFFMSNSLKFWALQSLSATHAAVISITEPLFALLIAYCMFNENMSFKKWIGLICCIGSGFLIVNNGLLRLQTQFTDFLTLPSLAMYTAIAASAYGALLMRKAIKYDQASPMVINGLSMALAGVFALSSTCVETSSYSVTSETFLPFASSLMLLVLLSNIIAYSIYGYLLKRYSVLLISCGSFIKPIAVIGYKGIFLHEVVPGYLGYSAVLLVIGLAVIYGDEVAQQEKVVATI